MAPFTLTFPCTRTPNTSCPLSLLPWSAEEQSTVMRVQLARPWAMHKMSSSEKLMLGTINSRTWWRKDLQEELMQRVNVSGFNLFHAQNVANGLDLHRDHRPLQRAAAGEIVNSVI